MCDFPVTELLFFTQFFPHVIHVKVKDGPVLELMLNGVCTCVCFCINGGSSSTTNFRGEMLFYGHFTLRERLFIATGYCFPKYEFYCWEEASGEQRVGMIIPVFAVSVHLRGIICPEFFAKGGTCWTTWNASVQ